MRRAFQAFLGAFGLVVIGISVAHLTIGPEAVIGGAAVNPTSVRRGQVLRGVVPVLRRRAVVVRATYNTARLLLAAALFVGGIGRLLAVVLVGVPHPFYVAMLVLELVVPPLMVLAARRVAEAPVDPSARG